MNTITQNGGTCVIDHEELLQRCMGNKPFAMKILSAFRNQLTDDLEELDEAIDSVDFNRITAIAHRIKGSSSNVSARRLNQAAASLEDFSKAKPLTLHELRVLRDRIRNEQNALVEVTMSVTQEIERTNQPCPLG